MSNHRTASASCAAATFSVLGAAALVAVLVAPSAHAAVTTVYSNVATFTGYGVENGGATTANPTTRLIADDIDFVSGAAGLEINSITFGLYNANAAATTFTPDLVFYQTNAGGGVGSVLDAMTLTPLTVASGGLSYYTVTSTGFFAIPANDEIWAGIYYSGATPTELNNLVSIIDDPVTVGSSQDLEFYSTSPGSYGSSPGGTYYQAGSTGPAENYAWAFTAIGTPVPEPSSVALLTLTGVAGLGLLARRRAARAA